MRRTRRTPGDAARQGGRPDLTGWPRGTVGDLLARSLLVGVLIGLAACGGAGTAATEAPDSDGAGADEATAEPAGVGDSGGAGECDLWTLDDVIAATGVEVVDTLGTHQTGQSACNYNDADGIPVATYVVISGDGPVAPSTGYDAVSEGTEPVSGIGDQAKWHELGTLYVMSGGDLFIASVINPEVDLQQKKDAAIDLARIAIERFQ